MKIVKYNNVLDKPEYFIPQYGITIFHKSEFEIDAFRGSETIKFNEVEIEIQDDAIINQISDIVNQRERLQYVLTKASHDFINMFEIKNNNIVKEQK